MATEQPQPQPVRLEAGTYEVLRTRLAVAASELADRAQALNARRLEVFGGSELRLAGSDRIRTGSDCVPRDIVAVGGRLLFGYNLGRNGHAGTRAQTGVEDVFSLHGLAGDGDTVRLEALPAEAVPGLLDDPHFQQDLAELYRYYRDARLLQLRLLNGMLLAVFQTGPALADIRVLRWRIAADGTPGYLDARGEREHVLPPAYDVTWTDTTRDDHVLGRHPHISIGGEVYVSTVAGTLTVKVEDTTETGEGIHSEPVDEPLQSLADAEVSYARAGALILLRIRPYNETVHRYLVFNTRTRSVVRLDGIGQACLRLPDDQGVIFPGGYCLATGVVKIFDTGTDGLEFERVVRSPNGEDVLYVFHARAEGRTLLLPYNVIREAVAAPLTCHGHALFDDGTLVLFRAAGDEPARVHPVQVWHTPYTSDTYAAAQPAGTGPLERVGNADLVRGIADCLSAARAARDMTPTAAVYEAITAACERISDRHHWLPDPGLGGLHEPLTQVHATAGQVLEEFETVTALTAQAAQALDEAAARITSLVRLGRGETLATADAWVRHLTELRQAQGHVESLRELRHADTDRIDALATGLADDLAAAAHRAVAFLARDDAFTGHHQDVAWLADQAEAIATTAEAAPLTERLGELSEGLRTVTEVVSALDIADPVVRTSVLERIAAVLADANRARATLTAHCKELLGREGRAEFAAESALLGQAVTAALAAAGTPEDCEDQLGRLLLRIENLQARFGEHPDFTAELDNRRAGIHDAFSARKQTLLDERARRADRLADSAARILDSVHRRLASLASLDEINTYFASDPMVTKVRQVADELRDLGDPVRAEELAGRLKAARQRAARALRDRADLYDGGDGGTTIRLGRHRFAVTTQRAELTLIPYKGTMAFALTGTDYRSPVPDPEFEATRTYWDQHLVSETPEVYRAEYLAASLLAGTEPLDGLYEAAAEDRLLDVVRVAAESRYDEGYERGIHDRDATAILTALLRLRAEADLLRYPATARAAAQLLWTYGTDEATRTAWSARAVSLARARAAFGLAPAVAALQRELALALATFLDAVGLAAEDTGLAGEYLFEELAESAGAPVAFITGAPARTLLEKFRTAVDGDGLDAGLAALPDDLAALPARHQLAEAWLDSFLTASGEPAGDGDLAEAVALQLCDGLHRRDCPADLTATVEGLLGDHPRLYGRTLHVRLDELLARTAAFHTSHVPGYRAYQRLRTGLLARERTRLRLDDLRPAPLTAFVRNRLLDEVYLPLIGDNLAKQLGAAGDAKRTDNSGLLLLISPPGYGKTTLVEYVADRLGLLLVKVSGPALGSSITSLDADHPEIKKIHFALAAANNVLLYLDDIQHVSPELLQRFIPLCDTTRRLGPYDLRGKRFAVAMSGNPYTESGALFRIPDMLANRADIWNLGDVLTGRDDLFALSFIENALTSNPVLAPLAGHDRTDLELLLRRARGDDSVRADQLGRPCPPAEFDRIIAVLTKLLHVRHTVLAVNRAYIASAAQADASRTEPRFRLQGSYRDMNKLTERIVPVMNDAELDALIDDHYRAEAQTLTSAAEANLLKLAELRGTLTPAQAARWEDVKAACTRTAPTG
ncbi:DNA repair ATPase [Streptomyces sp. NBC_01262]|uniref:DNA repair ATPase n=1 Tax=Streptomyces sp. NBC_01262 TaxID=2903803 RepID=UPI002E2F2414|nr:DNA repair ATPase [Streptomyces sp. NBC_01262]